MADTSNQTPENDLNLYQLTVDTAKRFCQEKGFKTVAEINIQEIKCNLEPGSDTFQTVFSGSKATETKDLPVSGSLSGSVGAHTLTTPQLSSHQHTISAFSPEGQNPAPQSGINWGQITVGRRAEAFNPPFFPPASFPLVGGGGSHTHPFTGSLSSASAPSASFAVPAMDVKHANVIVAAKD